MDKAKELLKKALFAEINAGKGGIVLQEPKELEDVDSDTELNNAFKELCSCVEMLTVDETDFNIITESAIKYSVKYAMVWAHTAYSQGLLAGINAAVEADAKAREKMKVGKERDKK